MRIRDKELKEVVDVCDRDCPKKTCYWPRPDPLRSYGYFVWVGKLDRDISYYRIEKIRD